MKRLIAFLIITLSVLFLSACSAGMDVLFDNQKEDTLLIYAGINSNLTPVVPDPDPGPTIEEDPPVPSDPNLVGFYNFNGNADDQSATANNGTVNSGVSLTTDRFGNADSAYFFDGTTGAEIIMTNNAVYDGDTTYCMWMKTDGTWDTDGSDPSDIASLLSRHDAVGSLNGFMIPVELTGMGALNIKDAVGDVILLNNPPGTNLLDNQWHHICVTIKQNMGDTVSIFIDGAVEATNTLPSIWNFNSQDIYVGGSPNAGPAGTHEEFKGSIDMLRIYNRILLDTEIAVIYNLEKP